MVVTELPLTRRSPDEMLGHKITCLGTRVWASPPSEAFFENVKNVMNFRRAHFKENYYYLVVGNYYLVEGKCILSITEADAVQHQKWL